MDPNNRYGKRPGRSARKGRGQGGGSSRPPHRGSRNPRRSQPSHRSPAPRSSGIDPFELFCAYHLGIGSDKSYRASNIHDVARRFGVDPSEIKQALQEVGMDPQTLLDTDFDLTMAQMDIQVAPEGVDRVELARGIYEEFKNAPRKKRDWSKILSDDEKENVRIFGPRGRKGR